MENNQNSYHMFLKGVLQSFFDSHFFCLTQNSAFTFSSVLFWPSPSLLPSQIRTILKTCPCQCDTSDLLPTTRLSRIWVVSWRAGVYASETRNKHDPRKNSIVCNALLLEGALRKFSVAIACESSRRGCCWRWVQVMETPKISHRAWNQTPYNLPWPRPAWIPLKAFFQGTRMACLS